MKRPKMAFGLIAFAMISISLNSCNEKKEVATESETETPIEVSQDTTELVANETVDTSTNEDWDQMLNDYDDYVTQYVALYKKAMKGDNSALSEYPAMMEKATALQESMAAAQNNSQLSTAQIKRMTDIQMKMVKAMQ